MTNPTTCSSQWLETGILKWGLVKVCIRSTGGTEAGEAPEEFTIESTYNDGGYSYGGYYSTPPFSKEEELGRSDSFSGSFSSVPSF